MDRLLTVEEVAELTGLTVSTLYQMRTRGGGPVACKLGRRIRYQPADVEAWVAANRQARTPTPEVTPC